MNPPRGEVCRLQAFSYVVLNHIVRAKFRTLGRRPFSPVLGQIVGRDKGRIRMENAGSILGARKESGKAQRSFRPKRQPAWRLR